MKILIDNGHGIDTKGKRSPDGRLLEYAQNRLLAGRIVSALQAPGPDEVFFIQVLFPLLPGGVYELSAVFHLCEQAVRPLIAIGLCVRTSITVPAGVKKGDQWRSQLSGFWGVEPFQSSK